MSDLPQQEDTNPDETKAEDANETATDETTSDVAPENTGQ